MLQRSAGRMDYCASALTGAAGTSAHRSRWKSSTIEAASAGSSVTKRSRRPRARSGRRASSSSPTQPAGRCQNARSKSTTGKCSTLPVWISVSDSNSSSSVPKPPGKMTKPSAALHEHRLARVEVLEGERASRYGFENCSCGSSMLKPIERPPPSCGAAVGRLHHARPAAGHDREAAPRAKRRPTVARRLVPSDGPRGCAPSRRSSLPAGRSASTASKPRRNSSRDPLRRAARDPPPRGARRGSSCLPLDVALDVRRAHRDPEGSGEAEVHHRDRDPLPARDAVVGLPSRVVPRRASGSRARGR